MSEAAPSIEASLEQAGLEYRAQSTKSDAPMRKAVQEQVGAEKSPAELAASMTNAQLAGLVVGIAAQLAPMFDKRLVYSDQEQAAIAEPLKLVLDKYLPAGAVPVELVLLGTVAMITAPKLLSAPKTFEAPAGGAEAKTPSAPAPESTH